MADKWEKIKEGIRRAHRFVDRLVVEKGLTQMDGGCGDTYYLYKGFWAFDVLGDGGLGTATVKFVNNGIPGAHNVTGEYETEYFDDDQPDEFIEAIKNSIKIIDEELAK